MTSHRNPSPGTEGEEWEQRFVLIALSVVCVVAFAVWLVWGVLGAFGIAAITGGMALGTVFVYVVSSVFGVTSRWLWVAFAIVAALAYFYVTLVLGVGNYEIPGTLIHGALLSSALWAMRLASFG